MTEFTFSRKIPSQPSIHHVERPNKITLDTGIYHVDTLYRRSVNIYSDLFVWSIGHQITWPERVIDKRVSSAAILHYVITGKGTFNGQEVHSGQCFFTMPYQPYSIRQDPTDPMEYYWLSFDGLKTKEVLKQCYFDEQFQIQNFDFAEEIIKRFDEALYEEHPKNDFDLYLISLCYQLLSLQQPVNLTNKNAEEMSKDYLYFKNATIYIEENLHKSLTVADVSQHLHISPSYCRFIIHKYSQYSPQKMIMVKKFEQARLDLQLTTHSVKEIAHRIGYPDQSLFSRQFKKLFGMSPIEYRDTARQYNTYSD